MANGREALAMPVTLAVVSIMLMLLGGSIVVGRPDQISPFDVQFSPAASAKGNRQGSHSLRATVPNRGGSDAMMEYKGYVGKVEFDDEAGIFHGEVINTRDVITFQGASVIELKKAFRDSVEDYLAFCQERGEEPEKPFSGQFVTRVSPDLHRRINIAATLSGKSLNAWVTEQLESGAQQLGSKTTAGRAKDRSRSKSSGRGEENRPA
jgi:predicted HicB family RNase H-like nuclease